MAATLTAYLACLATALPAAESHAVAPPAADAVFMHPLDATTLRQQVLSRPAAKLQQAAALQGSFVFRKYLHELPQPLQSRGEFQLARGLGIDWHTRQPFDSQLLLNARGISQRDDGKTTLAIDAAQQPAVRAVAGIFMALLSLDVATLQESFELYGVREQDSWKVGLRPKASALASLFSSAVISGRDDVESLVLHEAGGDRSEIALAGQRYSRTVPASLRALLDAGDGARR